MRGRLLKILIGAITLSVLGTAHPAAADPPVGERISTCGQTITSETAYLDRNLKCESGFSFTPRVGAVTTFTLDLRGHRLRGPGTGAAFYAHSQHLSEAVSLTVTNGRVDHWGNAFDLEFGFLTLSKVQIDHSDIGLICINSGCRVEDSLLSRNRIGARVFRAQLDFARTRFVRNQLGAEASFGSGNFVDSKFSRNRVGIRVYTNGAIDVVDSRFVRNRVGVLGSTPGPNGIQNGFHASLTGNVFTRNRDGIYLLPQEPAGAQLLQDNLAFKNKRYGIFAPAATDLGGNRGFANGKPCVGVVCSSS